MLTKSTIQPSRVWHVDHEQPAEVCQGLMDAFGQRNSLAFDTKKGFLHLAKQYSGSGEGECH